MSRALFPAWRPSADGRAALARLVERLQTARPQGAPLLQLRRPDQWHVTLCFVGDMPAPQATADVLAPTFAAAATRIPPHAWRVDRLAYWPQSGAVVALPVASPALQALCDASHDAVRRAGIAPADRTSRPHTTLAFLDRGLPSQRWLETIDCDIDPLAVDGFELLFNSGGRYDALGSWALTGAALPEPPRQDALF